MQHKPAKSWINVLKQGLQDTWGHDRIRETITLSLFFATSSRSPSVTSWPMPFLLAPSSCSTLPSCPTRSRPLGCILKGKLVLWAHFDLGLGTEATDHAVFWICFYQEHPQDAGSPPWQVLANSSQGILDGVALSVTRLGRSGCSHNVAQLLKGIAHVHVTRPGG